MDITGIDIAAVAGLVGTTGTAIVSIVKAVQASRKAGDADRRALDIEGNLFSGCDCMYVTTIK